MTKAQRIIGVIGGGRCSAEVATLATEVGRLIAQRRGILVCGGLYGVMEAACRGAKACGGTTIGILPGKSRAEANPFVDIPIITGFADARNVIIARTSEAVIAVDGEFGTLSEIAFCLKFAVPVIALKSWDVHANIIHASTVDEAVEIAFQQAGSR
jgi:uncharacterized protein (TIGR00725 family)